MGKGKRLDASWTMAKKLLVSVSYRFLLRGDERAGSNRIGWLGDLEILSAAGTSFCQP
jgi:hypothetical protein